MFGDVQKNIKLPLISLGEVLVIGPQNGLYKAQKYYRLDGTGIPIVRVDSFYDGKVTDYTSLKRLHCTEEELKNYGLQENDFVFNRVNGSIEHVGKSAIIRGLLEPTVFESNMMRARVDTRRVDVDFLSAYLCSDIVRTQIKGMARIANQASVNQDNIRNILIPLPDLESQRRYARMVCQTDKFELELPNFKGSYPLP